MLGGDQKPFNFRDSITPVVFCKLWVNKINTKGKKDHRLLICNEAYGKLYKEATFSKDMQESRAFRWFQVTKFIFDPSHKRLEMHFEDGDIIFEHEKAEDIGKILLEHILNINEPKNYPEINFPDFFIEEFTPSPDCVLLRYRARSFGKGREPSMSILNLISKTDLSNGVIDVTSYKGNSNAIDDLFFALLIDPRIKSIKLPKAQQGDSMWVVLARFLSNNSTLQMFEIRQPYDEATEPAFEHISSNENINLTSMAFTNTLLPTTTGRYIKLMLKNKKVKELKFSKAINGDFIHFMRHLIDEPGFFSVETLRISGQLKMDIPVLLTMCKNIKDLSLIKTGIDISEILSSLNAAKGKIKLNRLDISHNGCRYKIPPSTNFGGAQEIIVNSSGFTVMSLASIIAAVGKSREPCTLSLAYGEINTGDWKRLCSKLKEFKDLQINELIWDGNIVLPDFVEFLKNMPNLKSLSLKGSHISDGMVCKSLASFISNSSTLESLNISGDGEECLTSESSVTIIDAIRQNRSIHTLDIQTTPFKPSCLKRLANALMENRVVESISIDKNQVYQLDAWKYFFATLLNHGKPLQIKFPNFDMTLMEDQGIISSDTIEIFKSNLVLISRGNPNIEIPQESLTKPIEPPQPQTPTENTPAIIESNQKPKESHELLKTSSSAFFYEKSNVQNVGFSGIVVPQIPPVNQDVILKKYTLNSIVERLKQQ